MKIDLNDRAIMEIPTDSTRRLVLLDSLSPYLRFVITPRGHRSWHFIKHFQGKPVKVKIGDWPDMPAERAREIARTMTAEAKRGIDPRSSLLRARLRTITLGEAWDLYLEEHLKPHTRRPRDAESAFKRYCVQLGVRRPLNELTSWQIQQWVNDIGSQYGHATANRILNLVRACIRWAWMHGLVDLQRDPGKAVRPFKLEGKTRYLRAHEYRRLAAVLERHPGDIADAVWLLLFTGARKRTVLAMRWEEIDLEAGIWIIPGHKYKTGKTVFLPLTTNALEVLQRRMFATRKTGWVFPSRSDYLVSPVNGAKSGRTSRSGHLEHIDEAWRKLRAEAGLEDVRLHDLRHTAGSILGQLGFNTATIQKALGHASIVSTMRYTHMDVEPARAAMERAQQVLSGHGA